MLNSLRKRLAALRQKKDQDIANVNSLIGREQELMETIAFLEQLEKNGEIVKLNLPETTEVSDNSDTREVPEALEASETPEVQDTPEETEHE